MKYLILLCLTIFAMQAFAYKQPDPSTFYSTIKSYGTITTGTSTTTSGTAPLKLPDGILMATPEDGAIEYDGTNLYYTDNTATRRTLSFTPGANVFLSNLTSPTAINQNLIFNKSSPIIQSANNGTSNSSPTENLNIQAGDKTAGTGAGGDVNITSGSSVGGAPGNINLTSGSGSPRGQVFASMNILPDSDTGRKIGSNGARFGTMNAVTISSDLFNVSSDGTTHGGLSKTGSSPDSSSYNVNLHSSAAAENVVVYSASDSNSDSTATGNLSILTGNKTAGTGNSGPILIQTGTSSGGTRGIITLDGSNITLASQLIGRASTTAPNTAPIKLNAGVLQSVPQAGAIEYDGTYLFYTSAGGTRNVLSFGTSTVSPSRALASDGGGMITASATTATELGYLSGLTVTNGGVVYTNGSALRRSSVGTSGQILQSVGAGAPTWITPTNTNTASAIVQRDGSGNFAAGTITAALTGTASGNTTYTPNQYGVVLSGSGNSMSVLSPDSSTSKVLQSGGASANPNWLSFTNANTASTLVSRDASGNFTAGTITAALTGAASSNVLKAGDTMSGTLDMGAQKVTTTYVPVNASDLVNKTYADNITQSFSWKETVEVATTTTLPTYIYANGSSGVGATITGFALGALPAQDGIVLGIGDRLLVKNEVAGNAPYNGIYVVTATGSVGAAFILTRSTDCDQSTDINLATVEAGPDGTTQGGFGFRQSTTGTITVGTTAIAWTNFTIGTSYTFTSGTSLSGTTVSAAVDNSTVDISSNNIEVKSGGITNTQVNASAGIVDTKLATISTALKVSNSATTAASANTASAIVARDSNGDFSARTVTLTGTLNGRASTTAAGTSPLKISTGVLMTTAEAGSIEYDGTSLFYTRASATRKNLMTASAAGLTASRVAVLDSNGDIAAGTATSTESGYLSGLTNTNGGVIYGDGTGIKNNGAGGSGQVLSSVGAGAPTWVTATDGNTASSVVKRDGSGNFSAGTVTASLTGAASLNVLKAGDTMTGQLILPASTTAANSAPLKLSTGVLQSVPQAGAIEYDGTSLYYTNASASRKTLTISTDLASYLPLSGGTLTGQVIFPASTTASGTAPIKINTGVLMTTAAAGAMEFDGTNLYFTSATPTRQTIFTLAGGTLTGTLTGRASTTTASTAPIKLPTGILMSTPEAGAIEYDGTNLYYTDAGAVRRGISAVNTCEIIVGDPGAASPVLADDNDTPTVCANDVSRTMTITAVHCYAPTGSPTVTPIITGGSSTTILSGALTCSTTAGGAAGTLNGTPTQTSGQTIDMNITSAGGTAKYIIVRITRTL